MHLTVNEAAPMIQFDCVYKAFGDKTVVSAFTKTFDTGIYALTGPSGSGKTTILRLAAGLETPDAGTVTLSGAASFAFQEPRLIPWIKNISNVALSGSRECAQILLDSLGLSSEAESYPYSLSGGMQKRVSLARALCSDFDVLLLDEPFAGLDAECADNAFQVIKRYSDKKTIIISTHDMRIASMCDSVCAISQS